MALQDTIRNATRPVIANLIPQLGSRINIRRATVTRNPDNSSVRNWASAGDNLPCKLDITTQAHVQRVWGMTSNISVEGMMSKAAADTAGIKAGDGVVVASGFLAGNSYTVDQVKPDDLGQYTLLGLVEPRGAIG
jgi:hypothetical protein